MGKIKLTWNDEILFEGERTDGVIPPPPVVYTCPIDGLSFATQALLNAHTVLVHTPPVGILGSKTNPYKLDKSYLAVNNGFTWAAKGNDFGIGSNTKIYFEVDPALLKSNASAFQMVIKGMNCPSLWIYKAYYNKNTQTYTDDVYFTSKGTLDYVKDLSPRDLDSYKFLYGLENKEASWEIQLWVQMY